MCKECMPSVSTSVSNQYYTCPLIIIHLIKVLHQDFNKSGHLFASYMVCSSSNKPIVDVENKIEMY